MHLPLYKKYINDEIGKSTNHHEQDVYIYTLSLSLQIELGRYIFAMMLQTHCCAGRYAYAVI